MGDSVLYNSFYEKYETGRADAFDVVSSSQPHQSSKLLLLGVFMNKAHSPL